MSDQNMKEATIATVWPIARAVARHIREHHPAAGMNPRWFGRKHWDGNSYEAAAFAGPGEIEFRLNHAADVRIINLDIANVTPGNVHVGPIVPVGEPRIVNSRVIGSPNKTNNDVPWEFKYRDLTAATQAATVAKEVGASVTAGLRQSVGYGSEMYGIQGETELSLEVQASVKAAWENAMTSHRETEIESTRDITQDPWTKTVIERVETIGPARQTITAKGELKFGFRVHSKNGFVVWYDTTPAYMASAIGVQTEGVRYESTGNWVAAYRAVKTPESLLAPIRTPVYAIVEKVREFEENTNVDVSIRTESLTSEAQLREAIKLISLKGPDALKTAAADHLAKNQED